MLSLIVYIQPGTYYLFTTAVLFYRHFENLYFGLIGSVLQYGIVCESYTFNNFITTVLNIQKKNRACNAYITLHSFPILTNMNILPLNYLNLHRILSTFNIKSNDLNLRQI